ncbi:cytochrome P450 9e2 [Bicyclus anynana]|uniref:unspecific monooxygenase n=1 Tax=Bicyclus anynana TaxID=110368 RepID=A0A6J1NU85_BICAN|nr:cytochrome P450 9e2 [Bicyclus anynana]
MHNYFLSWLDKLLVVLEEWKLLLFLSFIFFVYFHYTNTFDYFEKRRIKYMKPTIFFGNLLSRLIAQKSFIMFQLDTYKYFKGERFGGIFEGRRPVLYVLDPELIKAITIRDSDHFCDRAILPTNEPKYINRSILHLQGSEWKVVRGLVRPAFSSARIKNMFPLIQECTNQLINFLDKYNNSDVEVKDMMVHLTLEITGVCAFGISTDTLKDENAEFKKTAMNFNKMSVPKRILIFSILLFAPTLMKYMSVSVFNYEANKRLVNILRKTRTERILLGTRRNDFLQLLIDASLTEEKDIEGTKNERHLDDDTVDAQGLIFLIAGFETTSTLLSFAIYQMTIQPEIQNKLRDHIEEITKGEELCYDHIAELDYLDAFISETLRMYPPVARLDRKCTKPYTLPGTSVQLKVNDFIAIPTYGIHMDPDIYPEPEIFKPERFTREGKNEVPSHLFLAFGAGPRNCIGARFAMVIAKATIVTLVRNYKFSMCPKTEVPIKFHKKAFLLQAESGIWVRVERI